MVLLAVAKENKLEIDFVVTNPAFDLSDDYLKLNSLGRVPTFVAADGWVLTEAIAIALYCELKITCLSPYVHRITSLLPVCMVHGLFITLTSRHSHITE